MHPQLTKCTNILWNYHSNLWKTCLFSVQANILEPRYRQMLQHKNCPVHISSCVSVMTTTIIICLYVRIKTSRQITTTALRKYFKVNRSPNTPTKRTVVWKPWHTAPVYSPSTWAIDTTVLAADMIPVEPPVKGCKNNLKESAPAVDTKWNDSRSSGHF